MADEKPKGTGSKNDDPFDSESDTGTSGGSGFGGGSSGGSSPHSQGEAKISGLLGDAFKKIVTVGLTGAFVAEETLKSYLSDLKLPKEVINGLIQSALKSKEEMASKITKEVVGMIGKIDLTKEVAKFLESHRLKVSAEIDFVKKDDKKENEAKT